MRKSLFILLLVLLLPCSAPASGAASGSREYLEANKLFASGRYPDALTLYQKVLAAPPRDVPLTDVYSRIGDSQFRLGSYQAALSAYRSALKERKEAGNPETQYWIGFCCLLLGRNEEAIGEFLKIPQQYPGSGMWVGTAYYWAGRASERLGKTEDAAAYYRKAAGNGQSTQGRYALKKAKAVKKNKN